MLSFRPNFAIFVTLLLSQFVKAELRLPSFFSDKAVLQQQQPIKIWGQDNPSIDITVNIAGITKTTTSDQNGDWQLLIDPIDAGGPHQMLVKGSNEVIFNDILIGEVWLGSGQSNMALTPLWKEFTEDTQLHENVQNGPYPNIRLYQENGQWVESNPENLNAFSALMFSFAHKLQSELETPVGIMVGAVGGTPSGCWLTTEMIHDHIPNAVYSNDVKLKKKYSIGELYQKHIEPLSGYSIKGILWDQGESGAQIGKHRQIEVMGALIQGWRKAWGQEEIPFLYMQKSSGMGCAYDYKNPMTRFARPFEELDKNSNALVNGNSINDYIRLRELPNTHMVTTMDLGPGGHPTNKTAYGTRAAEVALGKVYKKINVHMGPTYAGHSIEGNTVRIQFNNLGSGLAIANSDTLQGFAIKGISGKPVWADAKIDGNSVIVSSDKIEDPKVVFYSWHGVAPWANLFNKEGYPAIPFHTSLPIID